MSVTPHISCRPNSIVWFTLNKILRNRSTLSSPWLTIYMESHEESIFWLSIGVLTSRWILSCLDSRLKVLGRRRYKKLKVIYSWAVFRDFLVAHLFQISDFLWSRNSMGLIRFRRKANEMEVHFGSPWKSLVCITCLETHEESSVPFAGILVSKRYGK